MSNLQPITSVAQSYHVQQLDYSLIPVQVKLLSFIKKKKKGKKGYDLN